MKENSQLEKKIEAFIQKVKKGEADPREIGNILEIPIRELDIRFWEEEKGKFYSSTGVKPNPILNLYLLIPVLFEFDVPFFSDRLRRVYDVLNRDEETMKRWIEINLNPSILSIVANSENYSLHVFHWIFNSYRIGMVSIDPTVYLDAFFSSGRIKDKEQFLRDTQRLIKARARFVDRAQRILENYPYPINSFRFRTSLDSAVAYFLLNTLIAYFPENPDFIEKTMNDIKNLTENKAQQICYSVIEEARWKNVRRISFDDLERILAGKSLEEKSEISGLLTFYSFPHNPVGKLLSRLPPAPPYYQPASESAKALIELAKSHLSDQLDRSLLSEIRASLLALRNNVGEKALEKFSEVFLDPTILATWLKFYGPTKRDCWETVYFTPFYRTLNDCGTNFTEQDYIKRLPVIKECSNLLRKAYGIVDQQKSDKDKKAISYILGRTIRYYVAMGQPEKAEEWLNKFRNQSTEGIKRIYETELEPFFTQVKQRWEYYCKKVAQRKRKDF